MSGEADLLSFAECGDVERLVHCIDVQKVNVNCRGHWNVTPLILAAQCGHLEAVKTLLDRGASHNATTSKGQTPLHAACGGGYTQITEALLEAGAHVNASTKKGATPLYWAASNGHLEVARMLLEHGAEVSVENGDGDTPLHRAAAAGNMSMLALLVEYKADIEACNSENACPGDLAKDDAKTVLMYIEALRKEEADIAATGFSLDSPGESVPYHMRDHRIRDEAIAIENARRKRDSQLAEKAEREFQEQQERVAAVERKKEESRREALEKQRKRLEAEEEAYLDTKIQTALTPDIYKDFHSCLEYPVLVRYESLSKKINDIKLSRSTGTTKDSARSSSFGSSKSKPTSVRMMMDSARMITESANSLRKNNSSGQHSSKGGDKGSDKASGKGSGKENGKDAAESEVELDEVYVLEAKRAALNCYSVKSGRKSVDLKQRVLRVQKSLSARIDQLKSGVTVDPDAMEICEAYSQRVETLLSYTGGEESADPSELSETMSKPPKFNFGLRYPRLKISNEDSMILGIVRQRARDTVLPVILINTASYWPAGTKADTACITASVKLNTDIDELTKEFDMLRDLRELNPPFQQLLLEPYDLFRPDDLGLQGLYEGFSAMAIECYENNLEAFLNNHRFGDMSSRGRSAHKAKMVIAEVIDIIKQVATIVATVHTSGYSFLDFSPAHFGVFPNIECVEYIYPPDPPSIDSVGSATNSPQKGDKKAIDNSTNGLRFSFKMFSPRTETTVKSRSTSMHAASIDDSQDGYSSMGASFHMRPWKEVDSNRVDRSRNGESSSREGSGKLHVRQHRIRVSGDISNHSNHSGLSGLSGLSSGGGGGGGNAHRIGAIASAVASAFGSNMTSRNAAAPVPRMGYLNQSVRKIKFLHSLSIIPDKQKLPSRFTYHLSSSMYTAPEVARLALSPQTKFGDFKKLDRKAINMWAFGVLMWTVFDTNGPFFLRQAAVMDAESFDHAVYIILNEVTQEKIDDHIEQYFIGGDRVFIRKLLKCVMKVDPKERMTATDFLAEYNQQAKQFLSTRLPEVISEDDRDRAVGYDDSFTPRISRKPSAMSLSSSVTKKTPRGLMMPSLSGRGGAAAVTVTATDTAVVGTAAADTAAVGAAAKVPAAAAGVSTEPPIPPMARSSSGKSCTVS